jgi:iron complex transport system ATP-binding protein
MSEAPLRSERLTLSYGESVIVRGLDVELPARSVTAIVGANGSGKSTLLRAMARAMKPTEGVVLLEGEPIAKLKTKEVAKRLSLLPQSPTAPEGMTVEDLVARGRYPHQGALRQWSRADEAALEQALAATGTSELRGRSIDQLSGGQRQRAWIAMTLAQQAPLLLLDEPTTFLDLAHQLEVLDLLTDLVATHGRSVAMVLHDINQACRYADHIVALRDGALYAAGPPAEVVDEAFVEAVFDVRVRIIEDPLTGTPLCLPLPGSRHQQPIER